MTTINRTLSVPTHHIEKLSQVLEKLGKKATKLGNSIPTYKVLSESLKDISTDPVKELLVAFSEVEISYDIITVEGGWKFLASIETVDHVNGEPRNRVNGPNLDATVAKSYITMHQGCDHCNQNRYRKQTYIVQNDQGETKQIGSSCLKEFMGIDPAAAVAGLSMMDTISTIGEGDEWGCGSNTTPFYRLEAIAPVALSILAHEGWVSASEAANSMGTKTKTGDQIASFFSNNPYIAEWKAKVAPSDDTKLLAKQIMDNLASRILAPYKADPQSLDQFSFKIGIILNRGGCDHKDMQLLAAAIHGEAKSIAKSNTKSEIKNEWLPNVSEGSKVTIEATISMVKEVFSSFGSSLLVKFITNEGFPVTTFYSGQASLFTPGAKVTVKGTVKRLEDGKFGKATLITRCKVVA